MEKIDFEILLTPSASTSTAKDISLVKGMSLVAQQIKNIVSMGDKELPFSKLIGSSIQNYILKNKLSSIFLNESINSSIKYSIKDIFNISSSISQQSGKPGILTVSIRFDYKNKNFESKNNLVTVEVTTYQ